ncbi:uncharacterized protein LOC117906711 [Vitis riparia]|uniref:uncharacterized protein LOC117906711 n=1 Tax=Vitis riparia TaxID=96939 RepID=UPI00155B39DB|nr:uncharacterized protein LOC117906711 [Vitis riparia]
MECFLSRIQDKVVVEEREDEVFWVVTKSGSLSVNSLLSILEEVRKLKLNMKSTVVIEENAWRISEELKGKKCLILMDEVCDFIDLHKVMGIQDHQENKVVLASRLRDICKDLDADELINAKPLSDHEAFNMFKEKLDLSKKALSEFLHPFGRTLNIDRRTRAA